MHRRHRTLGPHPETGASTHAYLSFRATEWCRAYYYTIQPALPPPLNGHKKWRWCGHTTSSKVAMVSTSRQHHRNICPILAHAHIGAIMPETLESTPPSPRLALGRRSQKPTMRLSPETDAARHRARQGIREYELIWLLQQRLRAVSWPHWRLRCMQPLLGRGKRHGNCQTLTTLTRRSLSSACHACFMCSAHRSVLGTACR